MKRKEEGENEGRRGGRIDREKRGRGKGRERE